VTWVVSNTMEYGSRFRSLSQPISNDCCVTWCQPTVGVADYEDVNIGVVDYGKSPQHRCQFVVDITDLGTQLTQSPQHTVHANTEYSTRTFMKHA